MHRCSLQLHGALYPKVKKNPQLDCLSRTTAPPTREVLFRMEREGVLIDASVLAAQSRTLGERMMILEEQAYQAAGQPFNLGSPRQWGEILFDKMKLPALKKTATGKPSTDEDVLQQLAADYPLPRLLLEHRALSKIKATYTDKLPQMVNGRTGRVHTCFGQATAVTGRLASTEPNLQNIPIRTVEGRSIREAFVAPPFIEKYFIRYPGVAGYMQRPRELARAQGYVETVFGRRLWLPDINAGGGPRRQAAERAAINAPMPGTAADLLKAAMIEVQAWLDRESVGAKLVLQVHDELVLEAPVDHLDRLKAELALRMSGVAQLHVPLVVDVGSGPNWEQAH